MGLKNNSFRCTRIEDAIRLLRRNAMFRLTLEAQIVKSSTGLVIKCMTVSQLWCRVYHVHVRVLISLGNHLSHAV